MNRASIPQTLYQTTICPVIRSFPRIATPTTTRAKPTTNTKAMKPSAAAISQTCGCAWA